MGARIGIDVGGTFTDFIMTRDGAPPLLHKVLSTPADPSIAVVDGLRELAAIADPKRSAEAFAEALRADCLTPLAPDVVLFCLSDAAAEPMAGLTKGEVAIAAEPNQISLFALIEAAAEKRAPS